MDGKEQIPAEIKRFILTSIDSVPHLEAALLLRYEPTLEWDAKMMAQRLYISEKKAAEVLADLNAKGLVTIQQDSPPLYRYDPTSLDLEEKMGQLSKIYAKHLIEVTNLIHSKTDKQAQQLGDAFLWKRERD